MKKFVFRLHAHSPVFPPPNIPMIAAVAAICFFIAGTAGAREINRAGYTSSEVCAYCHVDIFQGWKKSAHSRSYSDPVYQQTFRDASTASKGKAIKICVKCHSPAALSPKGAGAKAAVETEGVTCDFCHTVEAVDMKNAAAPFRLDIGGQKRASMRLMGAHPKPSGFNPAAHQTAYAEWFNKSELCGGCHELPNANGLKVGTTYSEWKESVAGKQGIQCQGCHMAPVPGAPYVAEVDTPKKSSVPDHSLTNNPEKLDGAVGVEVVSTSRTDAGAYVVDIAMTNIKAGHNIPTGSPSRSLTLEVTLEGSGLAQVRQFKTFGKRIVDGKGNWLTNDAEAQIKGAKIKYNTALKPAERREVRFVFENAPSGEVKASARAFLTQNPIAESGEHLMVPLGSSAK